MLAAPEGFYDVSELVTPSQKKLMLFSGRSHPELAEEIAQELGCEVSPTKLYDFANGEIFVRFEESVRGSDAFVLQAHAEPLNKSIMEQLIMVDALKRASAKRITVITPFYGYARQDKKHNGREPITARLMANLFATAGADRLMAVDLHTSQIQGFFDGPVDHLFALPILSDYVGKNVDRERRAAHAGDEHALEGSAADRWNVGVVDGERDLTTGARDHARHVEAIELRGEHREIRGFGRGHGPGKLIQPTLSGAGSAAESRRRRHRSTGARRPARWHR